MEGFKFDADEFMAWVSRYPRIQSPSPVGAPIRAVLTPLQRDFVRRSGALRMQECIDVTVKPRQVGISTVIMLAFLFILKNVGGVSIGVVGADEYVLAALRRKFQIMLMAVTKNDPNFPNVKNENAEFCMLVNGSSLKWLQAGKRDDTAANAGRGDTFHILQFTEFAFWQNARLTMDSILPGMGRSDTSVILDSTANGVEGDGEEFYLMAKSAEEGVPGMNLFFWPWHMDPQFKMQVSSEEERKILASLEPDEKALIRTKGLTVQQIAWRRNKRLLMGKKFQETYPESFSEAFSQKNASVFEDRTMEKLRLIAMSDAWPAKIDPDKMFRWADVSRFGTSCATMGIISGKAVGAKGTGVWFFAKPSPGEKFLIAIDGSRAVNDFQSICVIRKSDRQIVAIARLKERSLDMVADVARVMSSIYGNAAIGVEEEISGVIIWRALAMGTPEVVAKQDRLSDIATRPWPALFGDGATRGLLKINKSLKGGIVYLLKSALDSGSVRVVCREMYAEMVSFVRKKDGTYGTRTAKDHDDILMSYGHGLMMCSEAGVNTAGRAVGMGLDEHDDIQYGVLIPGASGGARLTATAIHDARSNIRINTTKKGGSKYDFFD